jgi:hypothetical protein
MGPRQVLRVAAAVIGGIALALPAAAGPRVKRLPVAPRVHDEPVAIVDLRPPAAAGRDASRAKLAADLGRLMSLRVAGGDGLEAALAGDGGGDADLARAAVEDARAGYGALDCAKARPAAEKATLLFAARRAAGKDDGTGPRAAWAYVLLCADGAGDRPAAAFAAGQLRALGAADGTATGISQATWDRYPAIDAQLGGYLVELTVTAEAGAEVWVDQVRIGPSPATIVVGAGDHVVAAAAGERRGALRVTVTGPMQLTVPLADQEGAWGAVAETVRGWRGSPPPGSGLAALMRRIHVRFAFVLGGGERVEVWVLGPGDDAARTIDTVTIDDPAALGAIVHDHVAAWDGRAPDPDRPLLVEDRTGKDGAVRRNHWWVYASLIGAVVVGGAIVYAHDSAHDHQLIELSLP